MKRTLPMRSVLLVSLVVGIMWSSGCQTIGWRERQEMEEREDMLILQEDIRKLSGRVEGLEFEVDRVQGIRNQLDADMRSVNSRLDDLESRLASLDAMRQKDKQELIDKLSAKITELVGRQSRSSGKRSTRHYSDTGYEHVVKSGESLSEIATAYGVTVQAILDNNDIKNANMIRAGQKLFIPE